MFGLYVHFWYNFFDLWSLSPHHFLNIILVLLSKNSSAFLSFQKQVVCSSSVVKFVFLYVLLRFDSVYLMITFYSRHNFVIYGDGLLSDEDCRSERWWMLNLVEPWVGSDVCNSESFLRLRI